MSTTASLLAITAGPFQTGTLTALTQTLAWSVIVFFAIAQGLGALGPVVYGALMGDGKDTSRLFFGYLLGAGVMIVGGVVRDTGVAAEGKSLEQVATPLSEVDSKMAA